jgi:CBS domain-containing protein
MHHRTVEELMSRDVVRAQPDTPFKELVRLLEENDVTAVPVVDRPGRPAGEAEGSTAEELMSAPAVCARHRAGVPWHRRGGVGLRKARLPDGRRSGRCIRHLNRLNRLGRPEIVGRRSVPSGFKRATQVAQV